MKLLVSYIAFAAGHTTCPSGYTKGTQVGQCNDINECEGDNPGCLGPNANFCENLPGDFRCGCADGYALQDDNKTCLDKNECEDPGFCSEKNRNVCTNEPGLATCGCNPGWELKTETVTTDNGDVTVETCVNVNECTSQTQKASCDLANSKCLDTEGSYYCECFVGFGHFNNTAACSDINECTNEDCLCKAPNGKCTNNEGSYECECADGFEKNATSTDSLHCLDKDECGGQRNNPGQCSELNRAQCFNTPGSFECRCDPGWVLNALTGECDNEDECSRNNSPCDANASCTDKNVTTGFTCECNDGFTGDGLAGNCKDIDECENNSNAKCGGGTCINNDGGFTCECGDGLWKNVNGTCEDVNECTKGTYECGQFGKSQCVNEWMTYSCACADGFKKNDTHNDLCVDFNECVENAHNCGSTQTCVNTDGSFNCKCIDGYQPNGQGGCSDVNECAEGTACNGFANSHCNNIEPGFQCECDTGYFNFGNGTSGCFDVNECDAAGFNGCQTENQGKCVNTVGSFECACNEGYSFDSDGVCANVDECNDGVNNCDPNADCIDQAGDFRCVCRAGWTGNGVTCQDVVNCVDDANHPCGANGNCTETDGSYSCACNAGYHSVTDKDTGVTACEDINECAGDDTFDCGNRLDPKRGTCDNQDGFGTHPKGYTCICNSGFKEDSNHGNECRDFNECDDNNGGCPTNNAPADSCRNLPGSHVCLCNSGFFHNATSAACEDVDDCAGNPCGTFGKTCTDAGANMFDCTCEDGYSQKNKTSGCTDLNECTDQNFTPDCPADNQGKCINTIGGYDCGCDDGFEWNAALGRCQDIDECSNGKSQCGQFTVCENKPGMKAPHPEGYTCKCADGYFGPDAIGAVCSDKDECKEDACTGASVQGCKNMVVHDEGNIFKMPYMCTCKDGYWHGRAGSDDYTSSCRNRNECRGEGVHSCPEPNRGVCKDTDGSYLCECDEGFVLAGNTCIDKLECDDVSDNSCHANADCKEKTGGYDCVCKVGFEGDGRTCVNINECSRDADICDFGNCVDSDGSYTCSCFDGFELNGDKNKCVDTNECADTNKCPDVMGAKAINCQNTVGSFTCDCQQGFKKNEFGKCADYDECKAQDFDCTANSKCTNIDGNYECECLDGWEKNATHFCVNVNECVDADGNPTETACGKNSECRDTEGSFQCFCNWGYEKEGDFSDSGKCVDWNECEDESLAYACTKENFVCKNTDGSYECECNPVGFVLQGDKCVNDLECSTQTIADQCDTNAKCLDTIGSWYCKCNDGWYGNGFECKNVNECEESETACNDLNSHCVDNDGSFTCPCNAGWKEDNGTGTCIDADECNDPDLFYECPESDEWMQCVNEPQGKGYSCACKPGLAKNATGHCADIDECAQHNTFCGEKQECINFVLRNGKQGYACNCADGYKMSAETRVCENINECKKDDGTASGICGSGEYACHDNIGSYSCSCNFGYKPSEDGSECVDANECEGDGTFSCSAIPGKGTCVNKIGDGYDCVCSTGYKTVGNGCADINECPTGADAQGIDDCDANAKCENTVGGYKCACNAGYSGDGKTCTDNNECAVEGVCTDPNAHCENHDGFFNCPCNAGYTEKNQTCQDVDECDKDAPLHKCVANASCFNKDGGHECKCDAGWVGNDTDINPNACLNVDECKAGTHDCSPYAKCTDTQGSFTCECQGNYKGTGKSCGLCPSDDCWAYDDKTHQCSMKMDAQCCGLVCAADGMALSFRSDLFGIKDTDPVSWAGQVQPTFNAQAAGANKWGLTVAHGTKGMTHEVTADKLIFTLFVGVNGDQRARSDMVTGEETDLGHTQITSGFNGVAVWFKCSYNRSLTIDPSDDHKFSVEDVSVTDYFDAEGDLRDGFAMVLNEGVGFDFILGSELPVHINWAVQAIANLTFSVDSCNVNHGGESFVLIKNQCYATVINSRPLITNSNQSKAFEYRLFKAKGVTDPNQMISCSITVCDLGIDSGDGSCKTAPTTTCDCSYITSGDGQDDFYKLSKNGEAFDRANC